MPTEISTTTSKKAVYKRSLNPFQNRMLTLRDIRDFVAATEAWGQDVEVTLRVDQVALTLSAEEDEINGLPDVVTDTAPNPQEVEDEV